MAVNDLTFKRHTRTALINSTEELRKELEKAIFRAGMD